jgi:hypothetical protein
LETLLKDLHAEGVVVTYPEILRKKEKSREGENVYARQGDVLWTLNRR